MNPNSNGYGPNQHGGCASRETVSGLASEVEGVRKRMEPLHNVPGRLEGLALQVESLATSLQEFLAPSGPSAIPSWLTCPGDPVFLRELLGGLVSWLGEVFLRYPDGAAALPDCWLWHPHVVEELLWCEHMWCEAYEAKGACAALVADWHDRWRPGVVRRIATAAGTCSLEAHTTPQAPPVVPLAGAVEEITGWWSTTRDQAAPVPAGEHFAAVNSV